jgi:RNA:NAD 2'-phosphotransferase (TPT1/KptA family)
MLENHIQLMYITTHWPKVKVQKDKQRSTKHTHKTKDRVTRTSRKTRGELRCSRRVSLILRFQTSKFNAKAINLRKI